MVPQASFPTRRFLLAAVGTAGTAALAACVNSEPKLIYEVSRGAPPPVKMQRLLLWLPPDEKFIEWSTVSSQFTKALAPHGVVVQTGRADRLELSRGEDQKALIASFKPTYRLEVDFEGATASRGSQSATSMVLRAILYRGTDTGYRARFHYHLRSKNTQVFVNEVVEKLEMDGYLPS